MFGKRLSLELCPGGAERQSWKPPWAGVDPIFPIFKPHKKTLRPLGGSVANPQERSMLEGSAFLATKPPISIGRSQANPLENAKKKLVETGTFHPGGITTFFVFAETWREQWF